MRQMHAFDFFHLYHTLYFSRGPTLHPTKPTVTVELESQRPDPIFLGIGRIGFIGIQKHALKMKEVMHWYYRKN